jgi:adenylate cyclase
VSTEGDKSKASKGFVYSLGGFFVWGGDLMATDDVKRKLTAIFSADVEEYSRLMEEDELATVETLTSHKEIMRKLIRQYRGRVVDSTGDNLLAEFASVVDAVQCAVEVQQVLSAKNEALPENRRMNFRIGINSGDVIEEGELIYGDGVNVAARVESLAEGGGISISGTAYDQLGKKLPLGYEYLGEQSVKNIEKPVRVYRVLTEAEAAGKVIGEVRPKTKQLRGAAIGGIVVLILVVGALAIWNFYLKPDVEPASVEKMAFPLPDEPSIAVLPFANMSGDPQQEYLSDGFTEQIITGLSMVPRLFVIARNSTFTYKGKAVKVQQVAEELGVKYVLEGSVQKSGNRVRITAQLIDTTKGHHLWAERYDRNLSDIFALQDEIAKKVITALQVKLTEGEKARLLAKGTENLEAYLKFLQGYEHYRQRNPDDLILARQFFGEAIALDPEYGAPFIYMGAIHLTEVRQGLSKSPQKSINQAFELAQKALSLDELNPAVHNLLGWGYLNKRQYEKSIAACERALALSPNHMDSLFWQGVALSVTGRPHEAIPYFERALRLNPLDPAPSLFGLGDTYRIMGRYEEAIPKLEKALIHKPKHFGVLLNLAACYSELGREEEAHAIVEQLLKLNPKFSLERFAKRMLNRGAVKERYLAALRKAGLPETPPLPLPDKPSIAVLPFVNMSGDPEQEYVSDGISEEIITALSKTPKMFVIARTSSFRYKGKEVDVRTVGRELGVRYVLEGSVRRSEDQLRITAKLVDAKTGSHLWAERYDRKLKDIFAIQDEITMKIITAMQVKLTEGEQIRVWAKKTKNLDLYLKRMEALAIWNKGTKESLIRVSQLAQELVDMAPESAFGYRMLGWYHWGLAFTGASPSPRESIARAFKLAQKALAMDESDSLSQTLLGNVYLMMRQYEKAIAAGERAVALNPNGAFEHGLLGNTLSFADRPDEAIDHLKQGIRLNPFPEYWYFLFLSRCFRQKGQYEKALKAVKKALHRNPDALANHAVLAVIYILLDRQEEARAAAKKVLEIDPNYSVERALKAWPLKNQADLKLVFASLRKAGLK